MADNDGTMSRRDALKTSAKVAGVAAFATPVVMGVFSTRASAVNNCDPSVDSDAIDLLNGTPRKWNTNCSDNEKYGRYNAQRTTAELPGTGGEIAAINFGFTGTDNFPHECSFYTFDVPDGWECTATFVVGDANDTDGCPDGGLEDISTPGDCEPWTAAGTPSDFSPPPGANPVPYCKTPVENRSGGFCVSKAFLWLVEWSCCPPA
jgi:hypothetical protein